jgi:hypothetical protein
VVVALVADNVEALLGEILDGSDAGHACVRRYVRC